MAAEGWCKGTTLWGGIRVGREAGWSEQKRSGWASSRSRRDRGPWEDLLLQCCCQGVPDPLFVAGHTEDALRASGGIVLQQFAFSAANGALGELFEMLHELLVHVQVLVRLCKGVGDENLSALRHVGHLRNSQRMREERDGSRNVQRVCHAMDVTDAGRMRKDTSAAPATTGPM